MIEDIPEEDRASKINLERNEFPTAKTLGVLLTSNDDTFFFSCSPPVGNFKITKGNVLKKTASVYDPLGLISPYIMRAKVLMQHHQNCRTLNIESFMKLRWKHSLKR